MASDTGPKRACCICKLSKIRCEGGRPCSACKRKGLTFEHCIEGCRACRRARLICEGGKPCLNCLDTNQECIAIGEAPASLRPTAGEEASSSRQMRTKRTRIACLACRRDSKKCGDVRPCARCLSRKEECISLEPVGTIVKKRCQACRIYNRKCEDKRPCIRCVEEGTECIDLARKGGPGSRIRRACTNCRLAKSQCDNSRPCRNCERRKLDCDAPLEADSIVTSSFQSQLVRGRQNDTSSAGSSSYQRRGGPSGLAPLPSDTSLTGVHLLAAVATQDEWIRSEGVDPGISPSSPTQSLELEDERSQQTEESDELDSLMEEEELE